MYALLNTHHLRRGFWVGLTISSLLPMVAVAAAPAGESAAEENWYRVEIAGAAAGFMRERVTVGETITTESETRLEIRRGSTRLTIEMAQRFVESPAGVPLRAWTRQTLGGEPIETTHTFVRGDGAGEVRVVTLQGSQRQERTSPWPAGAWMTPARADDHLLEKLASGASSFTIVSVDPLAGLDPVDTRWELEERGIARAGPGGEAVMASRWRQTQDLMPGVVTTVWVDDTGRLLESRTSLMGLDMVVRLSDRAAIESASASRRARAAPEILTRTFVRPSRAIPRPRQLARAAYTLSVSDGELPELPSTGAQSVERIDARTARVAVEPGRSSPVEDGAVLAEYLRSSAFLALDDPLIRDLHRRALGEAKTTAAAGKRAETLRRFVHRHVEEKDLDSGLATASEVARTRAGDCTEHSMLLAALLRADDIPSRLVAGLVYVEEFAGERAVFGYHMWTQALIDGRWIDLDATFTEAFDATHIALTTASFAGDDPPLRALARLAAIMGSVQIEVAALGSEQ